MITVMRLNKYKLTEKQKMVLMVIHDNPQATIRYVVPWKTRFMSNSPFFSISEPDKLYPLSYKDIVCFDKRTMDGLKKRGLMCESEKELTALGCEVAAKLYEIHKNNGGEK